MPCGAISEGIVDLFFRAHPGSPAANVVAVVFDPHVPFFRTIATFAAPVCTPRIFDQPALGVIIPSDD